MTIATDLEDQPMGGLFAAGGIVFALGHVLLGVSIARARVIPRWIGASLIAGAPVLGLSPLMPLAARFVGCAFYGAAYIGVGLALLRGSGARAPSAVVREQVPAFPAP